MQMSDKTDAEFGQWSYSLQQEQAAFSSALLSQVI